MISPVVSCKAVNQSLDNFYHHRWVLVDAGGMVITQTKLDHIELSIKLGYLVFQSSGMLRLDIPIEVEEDDEEAFVTVSYQGQNYLAVSEGDLASAWFSNVLAQPTSLMKIHPKTSLI